MSVFGFRGGPEYRAASQQEQLTAAFERPMSMASTAWDQAKGGVLSSFGLGTIIRETSLPSGAPTKNIRESPAAYEKRRAAFDADNAPLNEDDYKSSPYFRQDVPWDAGMTAERAAALADMYDRRKVREFFAEKRPFTAFIGNLAGQALDPINYIPVAGPVVKAAAIARLGTIGGRIAVGALDAAANTAAASIATRGIRRQFGDDVSWQTTVSEIATAALIGSAFGGVGGLIARRADVRTAAFKREAEQRLATLRNTQEARIALNEAIDGLANEGEIKLSSNATAPVVEMAAKLDEFDKWFAGSVVADDAGAPVRVYHGTTASFDEFDTNAPGAQTAARGGAIYFTDDAAVADSYGARGSFTKTEMGTLHHGQRTIPAFLSMKNPLVVDAEGRNFRDINGGNNNTGKIVNPAFDGDLITGARGPSGQPLFVDDPRGKVAARDINSYIEEAKASGHDGLVVRRVVDVGEDGPLLQRIKEEGGRTTYVVFDKSQVRSSLERSVAGRQNRAVQSVDTSQARPDPVPEGRAAAEASIAKAETARHLADQYGVDPATGSYPEEAELQRMIAEGRVTEDEIAALNAADAALENGSAYGEALKAVVGCLI